MFDENVHIGLARLLDDYLEVEAGDRILVAYTDETREMAALVAVGLEARTLAFEPIWMLPLRDDGFVDRLRKALPSSIEAGKRLIILTLELETMSHTDSLRAELQRFRPDQCRVYRAIGADLELFSQALQPSPRELSDRNASLLHRLDSACEIRIRTESGTDLQISLDSNLYRWISNRGIWRPGAFVILPAGEVATYPAEINGTLVADFAFHINAITDLDVRLEKNPVTVTIENGRAVDLRCDDSKVLNYLRTQMSIAHGNHVGELGFGTNYGVIRAIQHNSHVNERVPGVHLGFGQHNQGNNGSYFCPVHIDLIARGGFIKIDQDSVPVDLCDIRCNGEIHLPRFFEEDVLAPNSKDIFDDCCGTINCGS